MESILSLRHVQKKYQQNEVLKDISFDILPGQIVGLMGPNGSGKTTLIKIINTLITDYSGEVLVCGSLPGIESKKIISYLPDKSNLIEGIKTHKLVNIYDDFFENFDRAKAFDMLKTIGIDKNVFVRTLSKGMREKLILVLTMSKKAKLYIFDEPIAGVDPAAREFILSTIIKNYSENSAILFSTHLISDAEQILSRVLFLRDGVITLDMDTDELREKRQLSVDQIFREEFRC